MCVCIQTCTGQSPRPALADTPPPPADTPAPAATAADGTHPTGMHSCILAVRPENIGIINHSRQLNFIIAIIWCHDFCLFLESPSVMTIIYINEFSHKSMDIHATQGGPYQTVVLDDAVA